MMSDYNVATQRSLSTDTSKPNGTVSRKPIDFDICCVYEVRRKNTNSNSGAVTVFFKAMKSLTNPAIVWIEEHANVTQLLLEAWAGYENIPDDNQWHPVRPRVDLRLHSQAGSIYGECQKLLGVKVRTEDVPDWTDTIQTFHAYIDSLHMGEDFIAERLGMFRKNWTIEALQALAAETAAAAQASINPDYSKRFGPEDDTVSDDLHAELNQQATTEEHAGVSDLDKALPRTDDNKPAAKWQDDNKLLGAFWGKLAKGDSEQKTIGLNKFDWWRAAADLQRRAWVHAALQVPSLHDYAGPLDEAIVICATRIPSIATAKNAEPATTPDNPPSSNAAPDNTVYQDKSENSTTSLKGIPMVSTIQVIEGTLEMSAAELPCAEYPFVTLLSMWKYGKEFKHTVRGVSAGNLADRVEAMIDEFTRRGYTLNPTQTAPMPQAPLAFPQQNTAPVSDAPAPQTTVEGGQVETICQVIMHSKDTAKGKEVTYDLMPMLGNGKVGQYRVVTLRNQRDLNMLTAAGVRLEEIKPELPYPVNLKCTWKNGKEFEPGKFYRDLVSLEPIAA